MSDRDELSRQNRIWSIKQYTWMCIEAVEIEDSVEWTEAKVIGTGCHVHFLTSSIFFSEI